MEQGGYLLLSTVAFFLTGVGLYAVDKKLTVAFRRFLHGWTRPEDEPFPESKNRGLIYGQKAKQRFAVAGTISLIQTLFSVTNFSYNPLLEMMTMLVETPIMVLGTYLGERMTRLFGKAQPVFDAIDRIDAGESTAGEEAREILQDLTGADDEPEAPAKAPASAKKAESAPTAGQSSDPTAAPESEPAPEDEDPRELMKKYTSG